MKFSPTNVLLLVAALAAGAFGARTHAGARAPQSFTLTVTESTAVNGLDTQYSRALEALALEARGRLVLEGKARGSDRVELTRQRNQDGSISASWLVTGADSTVTVAAQGTGP